MAVYTALVAGGCLAPDDSGDGLTAIAQAAASDAEPPWLACLYKGGSVAACGVPCRQD